MDLRKLCAVALHPEGVDRNREISVAAVAACIVALHPEGVDRNKDLQSKEAILKGRPPPGGRG